MCESTLLIELQQMCIHDCAIEEEETVCCGVVWRILVLCG